MKATKTNHAVMIQNNGGEYARKTMKIIAGEKR